MRKLTLFMHTSLDGFVARKNGEMNWIKIDEQLFEYAGNRTANSDTALYGRATYEMMDAYWPTAADQPYASAHDIEHGNWYNEVEKIVVSKTMNSEKPKTKFIHKNIAEEIKNLKEKEGKEIVMFGSPTLAHELISENLIDDYWLFVNPVILGDGIPLFKNTKQEISLKLAEHTSFECGVICLHYQKI